MKKGLYERRLRLLKLLFLLATAGTPLMSYFVTTDFIISAISLAGCLFLCVLAYILHHLDDVYITGIVVEMSNLLDVLTELEEKEIFPENEDTVLSKLQNKVIKLARILKDKNKLARQEHENIKELVSDISHQLKTPISNLRMYSRFLADEPLTEEKRREYVGVLRFSVERLNFLSENMIKISRLESGMLQLNMQKQSLNETVMMHMNGYVV